tara:strand:+ start:387 stop:689 length:303 start_codon:yes stop_codon:yes gene_type:complete
MAVNPKCLKGMSCIISADNKYYPCCFVYTNKEQLTEWAERSNNDIDQIDIKKHGYTKVLESKFLNSFYNSFDIETCHRECGDSGYEGYPGNHAKWIKYER